jgi:hypothetical protein
MTGEVSRRRDSTALDRLLQDRWPGKARRRSARLEIDHQRSILEILHQRRIVEDLGTSGYEVREDVLHLPAASPATAKLVKGA